MCEKDTEIFSDPSFSSSWYGTEMRLVLALFLLADT